jgi:hypothetical protein
VRNLNQLFYAAMHRDSEGERFGQALYNALDKLDHKAAVAITGTNADPFYENENIPKFLEILVSDYDWNWY